MFNLKPSVGQGLPGNMRINLINFLYKVYLSGSRGIATQDIRVVVLNSQLSSSNSLMSEIRVTLVSSDIQRPVELPAFLSLVLPLSPPALEISTLEPNPVRGSLEQLIKLLERKQNKIFKISL